MVITKHTSIFFFITLLLTSCTSVQHISKTDVNYAVVRKETAAAEKQEVTTLIAPYKVQLDAVMNEELGTLPVDLTKQKPESTLGNWAADALLDRVRKEGLEADFAIVNYGGLRLTYLTKGPLTRGELFELSPFDNVLQVVDVPGIKLDSVFQLIAETDGWPVSKGVKLVIGNKKLISAYIHNMPLDHNKIYKMATIDYVATGGDNMKFLIPLARKQTELIFRDVLIDHVKDATASGKPVTASLEGRITVQ